MPSTKTPYTSPAWFRALSALGIALFAILFLTILGKLFFVFGEIWFLLPLLLPLGWMAADFIGGTVHWACDTWGSSRTPIVGTSLIAPFREHHVDPKAMTTHDLIETSGGIALLGCLNLGFVLWLPLGGEFLLSSSIAIFITTFTFFGFLTNEIHKYAHSTHLHPVITRLQFWGVILSPKKHAQHHKAPYIQDYCITSGFLNPFLKKIDFFHKLEKVIFRLTKVIPRSEDLGEQEAQKIFLKRCQNDSSQKS